MIRVCIVDDQRLMRDGLRTLLSLEQDIEIVGTAQDGEDALRLLETTPVDVVLMDIRMPNLGGIEATKQIKSRFNNIFVLMLTTYDEVDDVVGALSGGAVGYLLKDMPAEEIAEAIRTAVKGDAVLPPSIASTFLSAVSSRPLAAETRDGASVDEEDKDKRDRQSLSKEQRDKFQLSAKEAGLTEREIDVLHCLAKGFSNREIATVLCVTEGTVKNHMSSLISKLDLRDRTQVALYAVRHGFGGLDV